MLTTSTSWLCFKKPAQTTASLLKHRVTMAYIRMGLVGGLGLFASASGFAQDAPAPVESGPKIVLTSCNVVFAQQSNGLGGYVNSLFGLFRGPAPTTANLFRVLYADPVFYQAVTDRVCERSLQRLATGGTRLANNEFEGLPTYRSLATAGAVSGVVYEAGNTRYQVFAPTGKAVVHPSLAGQNALTITRLESEMAQRINARILRVIYTVDFQSVPLTAAQQALVQSAPSHAQAIDLIAQTAVGAQFSNHAGTPMTALRSSGELNYQPQAKLFAGGIANLGERVSGVGGGIAAAPAIAQQVNTTVSALKTFLTNLIGKVVAAPAAGPSGTTALAYSNLDITLNQEVYAQGVLDAAQAHMEAALRQFGYRSN
jgi:hypothetical protein